ncbi:MAG: glycosyltransferase [Leptospirales bacterium]|nr:glycosyltransferase [Leptospirales bacterium]
MARKTRRSETAFDGLRIAVVHDWLTGMRGGEVVLEEILRIFPQADLFTLLHNRGRLSEEIEQRRITCSFINRLPLKNRLYRHYLALFPTAIERLNLVDYDLVLSSSHCVAKGVIPGPRAAHVSYVHSPMRYVWDQYQRYFPPTGVINRLVVPFLANYLRLWDAASNARVDRFVCNSRFVAARIAKYYGRQAIPVAPPCVADDFVSPRAATPRGDFYLIVSALVPYKRIDLAIEAFRRDSTRRLIIIGSGPEEKKLRKSLPDNVQMPGPKNRAEIEALYASARALIFPGEEDFGIVPVEAQSFLCPVIAYGRGGALETVVNGKTGEFFYEQTPHSLLDAILRFEKRSYRTEDLQKNARKFSASAFRSGLLREVQLALEGKRSPCT